MQRWGALVGLVPLLVLSSCSGPKYTRVEYAGGWSVDCPAEFEHSFAKSLGPYAELEMTNSSGSILISVYGLNLPYSDVVDSANDASSYMKGSLVTRGESLSVLEFKVPDSRTGEVEQHVYVVRNLGFSRTGIVEGKTRDADQSAKDDLTRYCTRIAGSMVATSSWMSEGRGEPGP